MQLATYRYLHAFLALSSSPARELVTSSVDWSPPRLTSLARKCNRIASTRRPRAEKLRGARLLDQTRGSGGPDLSRPSPKGQDVAADRLPEGAVVCQNVPLLLAECRTFWQNADAAGWPAVLRFRARRFGYRPTTPAYDAPRTQDA